MQEAPHTGRLSRRSVLAGAATLGLSAVAARSALSPTAANAEGMWWNWQNGWRFCVDCFVLYLHNWTVEDSVCPRNSNGHRAAGWTFQLRYTENTPPGAGEEANVQANWRHCQRCAVLYWGLSSARLCPKWPGTHSFPGPLAPRQYMLYHSVGQPAGAWQNQWRFCFKCSALFYNGYAYKGEYGLCPYDRIYGHTAAGLDFALNVSAYT